VIQDSWAIKRAYKSDTVNFCKSAKSAKIQTMIDFVSRDDAHLISNSDLVMVPGLGLPGYLVRSEIPNFEFLKSVRSFLNDHQELRFSGWHLSQQFTLPLFKIGCHVIFCLSSVLGRRRPSIEMNFLGQVMVLETILNQWIVSFSFQYYWRYR
jgi:hypothetical protein